MKYLILLIFSCLAQAETTLKWAIAHDLHYHIKVAGEFKNEIEKTTNGRLKIDIRLFNSNASRVKSANELISSGEYDIAQDLIGNFSNVAPEVKIWDIPFLFEDFAHTEKYIATKNAQVVLNKITASSKFEALAYSFSGGPIFLLSNSKIQSFDELKNKTILLKENFNFATDFLSSRQINGVKEGTNQKLDIEEELAAFIDGIYILKDPTTRWVNLTSHRFISRLVFVSKDSLKKISAQDQTTFRNLMKKYMKTERILSRRGAELGLELLKNRDANLNIWTQKQVDYERKQFKSVYDRYFQELKSEIQLVSKLAKFRGRYEN